MKRLTAVLMAAFLLLPLTAFAYSVSINQFVEHPSLNESVRGFKDALQEAGLDVQYNMHNAQGNMPTVLQIVNQILGEKPDLVLAVATPSAQASAQKIKNIPVLFTAVTDPVSASLVASMEKPGANVSGTTDMNPLEQQLALMREIHPDAKTIGVVYNSGEANSVVQVELLKKMNAEKHFGFTIVEAPTVNSAGVYQAAKSLVGKAELVYLPTDNTVIANLESVFKVCLENKLPLYSAEAESVRRAGVASPAINYYELGRQTGRMAAEILTKKAKVSDMPVESLKKTTLVVNPKVAAELGVTLPKSVMDRAEEIVE